MKNGLDCAKREPVTMSSVFVAFCFGDCIDSIIIIFYIFSCIFILLPRESDQSAIRARLGVASHLFATPRWGNPAKCLSQRHNK